MVGWGWGWGRAILNISKYILFSLKVLFLFENKDFKKQRKKKEPK